MRVLITGATGFIGRRLLPLLTDHEVLSLTRAALPMPAAGPVRTIAGDLGRPGAWQDDVERFAPQWCLHLAWQGLPDYSLAACRANLDVSLTLLETLARTPVTRVVAAGSCWEYGRAAGSVREDQAPVDCGVFASTKHAIRAMFESVGRERGFATLWSRVFFAYGPGQRAVSLVPGLCHAYASGAPPTLREPNAAQGFVFVDDAARGVVALAGSTAPAGVYNIGSGRATRVGAVANLVARHFRQPAPFDVPAGDAGFWADTTRMEAATGWRATTDIDEGIRQTVQGL